MFNKEEIRDIESRLSELLDDAVEVESIERHREQHSSAPNDVSNFRAFISYDGKDNRGYRGSVYFNCHSFGGDYVEDFEIVDMTGAGYRRTPWNS